jgi:hypothetical protein
LYVDTTSENYFSLANLLGACNGDINCILRVLGIMNGNNGPWQPIFLGDKPPFQLKEAQQLYEYLEAIGRLLPQGTEFRGVQDIGECKSPNELELLEKLFPRKDYDWAKGSKWRKMKGVPRGPDGELQEYHWYERRTKDGRLIRGYFKPRDTSPDYENYDWDDLKPAR